MIRTKAPITGVFFKWEDFNMTKLFLIPVILLSMFLSKTDVNAQQLGVEYLGNTKEIFTTTDDFFVNISSALPGDELSDFAYLKNTSNKDIKMYFKTEPLIKDNFDLEEDYRLLEEIALSIHVVKNGESKQVYEGPLGAKDFTEFQLLGTFEKDEEATFEFKLSVPHHLTNEFNMTMTQVKWIFGVGEIDSTVPKTSDDTNIVAYIVLASTSFAFLGYILLKKKQSS